METEKILHKQLVKLLRIYQNTLDFIFFHVKNDVGVRRGNFFFDLKHLGVLPGVADFCIIKQGEVNFLEIKTKRGKLSKNQKKFQEDVTTLGHKSYVAYGWDDILKKIDTLLTKKEEEL